MSDVFLAIGAAHALPPILSATTVRSKRGLWVRAAIAVLIALASGNPAFIVVDLIGVALGACVGLSILDKQPRQ